MTSTEVVMFATLCSRLTRGLLLLACVGPLTLPPMTAAQAADPLPVVQALHAAWDEYDGRRALGLFAADAVVTTRLASDSTPLSLVQRIATLEPFMNERMRATDFQVYGTTVTWAFQRTNDTERALGLGPETGTGEAVVEAASGKITSFVLHEDPDWADELVSARAAAYPVLPPGGQPSSSHPLAAALQLDDQWDLYAFDLEGSVLTRLTNTVDREAQPIWSPDGRWIAFTYGQSLGPGMWLGTNNEGLYVVRSDGTALHKVASGTLFGWTWSPDSSMLAYSTGQGTTNWFWCTYDTFTVHAIQASTGQELGAFTGGMFPVWANSGELILLRQAQDPASPLLGAEGVNLDTGASRSLGVPAGWYPLAVAPSGDQVVWVGGDNLEKLMVSDVQGGRQTILGTTTLPLRAFVARYAGCSNQRQFVTVWTPDGHKLLVQQLDTSDPQALRGMDPANIPLNLVQLAALDVSGGTQPRQVMPYPQLLSVFQGVFIHGASSDRTGRTIPGVMESDLGIATAVWSPDGERVLYAVTASGPESGLWRFFAYRPSDGTTTELLGGLAPWRKAFLT